MTDDRRTLYAEALEALLRGDMAKLAVSREFRLLAEVARLAQWDAPVAFAGTDPALYQAWREAVTRFHLGGWTNMSAQRVKQVADQERAPLPATDYAAQDPPPSPGGRARGRS